MKKHVSAFILSVAFFIKVESFINFTKICNFHENIAYDNAVNRIGGGKRYA